ncbi:MAG: hypothetical protein ACREVV_05275 [Steroidobacteraceae bacterium]
MTRSERARFQRFLAVADERIARDREYLAQLRTRFHLSVAIEEDALPRSLAAMYSQVRVRDLRSGRTYVQTVALPPDTEVLAGRRALSSWAAPLLLGAREGDEVQWHSGGALERLRIEKVVQQTGVAVPPSVSSPGAWQEDTWNVPANTAGSPQSAEREMRMPWTHYG